ncbi:MAG: glycoside hydrolase family 3 protein [Candidatus Eiseniibacteriota bacterium]
MTTDEIESHLGDLLMVGVPGETPTPEVASELRRIAPAGVIFFAPNFPNAGAAARWTREAQSLLGSRELPALIAADEEGGMVSQLAGFWEVPPNARAVAASGGPPLVKDLAQRTARRLLLLGVNLNFAPVLDIHSEVGNPVIGIRSYGTTASQVTACGLAAMQGIHAAGVIPVVKHFPGHGDTGVDSHLALPRIDTPASILALRELRPFEAAVNGGVPVVMIGHLVVPAFDPEPKRPATLSHPIVTGLLRERMGFGGVVVTDALEMAAVTSLGDYGEIAVRAIEAGCDLLLYSKLSPGPDEALRALRDALRTGRLSVDRIEASRSRIRALRASSAAWPHDWSSMLEREARDLIRGDELERIADGALRVVRQGAGGVPLRSPVDVLEVNRPESRAAMTALLQANGIAAHEFGPDTSLWPRRIDGSALLTVAARGELSAEQGALAQEWLRRYPETVTVASLNPHVADNWGGVRTLLVTFDNTPASRRALARRLASPAAVAKK